MPRKGTFARPAATPWARRLRRAKAASGLSIKEVARRARVAYMTAWGVFQGYPCVHLGSIFAVARAVGLKASLTFAPKE